MRFFLACWFFVCIFVIGGGPFWAVGTSPVNTAAQVLAVNAYTLEVEIGGFGSVLGYFHFPAGISGDSQFLYIADSGNGRIVKTDFNFLQFDSFQPMKDSGRPLDRPWGVAVDGKDVWVTDTQNHRVIRYSAQGVSQGVFGELGIFDGSFDTPKGVVAKFGDVWVADSRNHRVQEFQGDVFLRSFGGWGDAEDALESPCDVLFISSHELLVSDGRRLAVFNDLGQWMQDIVPVFSEGMPALGRIRGVGIDQDGRLFVADPDHSRVVVLKRNGEFLAVLPVASPEDIYAWGDLVFVTDINHHKILRFRRRPPSQNKTGTEDFPNRYGHI